ncbi:MAG: hypothetical protein WCJ19_00850 [bacterium]
MARLSCYYEIDNFYELKKIEKDIISNRIIINRSQEVFCKFIEFRKKNEILYPDYGKYIKSFVMEEKYWTLLKEEYPVFLPEDCEHWVLWIADYNISNTDFENILDEALKIKGWKKEEIIYFEKIKNNRSVPEVRHWHIYAKLM